MGSKILVLLALSAAASAAPPPLPSPLPTPSPLPVFPDTARERLQAEIAVQQAQAQARIAAEQARVQARLDANQARLEAQLAAQEAGTQSQLNGAGQSIAMVAPLAGRAIAGPVRERRPRAAGTMRLITLTPQLGRYFGTDHGVLVARAPTHGVLELKDGDVILSIGGRVPASSSQAIRILTSYDPGEKIRLVILREHHRITVTARLPTPPAGP